MSRAFPQFLTLRERSWSMTKARFWQLLPAALLCATFTAGAVLTFPIMDDGWLVLLLKEHGASALISSMPDRPLMAWLWSLLLRSGRLYHPLLFTLHGALWLIFALEGAFLWRTLFPKENPFSSLVACLTVAPIVVQTQLNAQNVTLSSNLSACLAYPALLQSFRFVQASNRKTSFLFAGSLLLLGVGICVNEYAIPVALANLALLLLFFASAEVSSSRSRALATILSITAVMLLAYTCFLATSSSTYRLNTRPDYLIRNGALKLLPVPFALLSNIWYCLIGSYGRGAAAVGLFWDGKSSIAAALYGVLLSSTLFLAWRKSSQEPVTAKLPSTVSDPWRIALCIAALAVGLIPATVMRGGNWEGFSSRFYIPMVPIATAITASICLCVLRPRYVAAFVLLAGFIVGYTSFMLVWRTVKDQQDLAAVGVALQPLAAAHSEYTLAILPKKYGADYDLTGKATLAWPAELSRKVWLISADDVSAAGAAGLHIDCGKGSYIDRAVRSIVRKGRIDQILWVEPLKNGSVKVRSYCRGG